MIIEGRNAVREALNGGKTIDRIVVSKGYTDNTVNVLVAKAKEKSVRVDYADKKILDKLSENNHQGIIAYVTDFEYSEVEDIINASKEKGKPALILILDGIEDPHNLGSIIRAAECMGADGVIIPSRRAVSVNETVVKTSSGATEYVKVARVTNINDVIRDLKKRFIKIVALDLDGDPIESIALKDDVALVIGGEGGGVKHLTRELSDSVARIPMYGSIASMNASVAAGIALYECRRQRD